MGYDGLLYALEDPRGPLPASTSADFNRSGKVDYEDFFAFAEAFGQRAEGPRTVFDLDGDGTVDFDDFFIFAVAFGKG